MFMALHCRDMVKTMPSKREFFSFCQINVHTLRDTTFACATPARSVSGEGEGARKCRFYVLRANVVRANVV